MGNPFDDPPAASPQGHPSGSAGKHTSFESIELPQYHPPTPPPASANPFTDDAHPVHPSTSAASEQTLAHPAISSMRQSPPPSPLDSKPAKRSGGLRWLFRGVMFAFSILLLIFAMYASSVLHDYRTAKQQMEDCLISGSMWVDDGGDAHDCLPPGSVIAPLVPHDGRLKSFTIKFETPVQVEVYPIDGPKAEGVDQKGNAAAVSVGAAPSASAEPQSSLPAVPEKRMLFRFHRSLESEENNAPAAAEKPSTEPSRQVEREAKLYSLDVPEVSGTPTPANKSLDLDDFCDYYDPVWGHDTVEHKAVFVIVSFVLVCLALGATTCAVIHRRGRIF